MTTLPNANTSTEPEPAHAEIKPAATYAARTLYDTPGYAADYDRSRFKADAARSRREASTRSAVLAALARVGGGKRVLDLPCGTGRMSHDLVLAGYDYTGADLSPAMLEVARSKWTTPGEQSTPAPARFVEADAERLPFSRREFDTIVCVRFFNLVPSGPRRRILCEMARVAPRLVIASGYFRRGDGLLAAVAPLVPRFARRVKENRELHEDLIATGWLEEFWINYKSRGPLSTTKAIGVFRHA